MAPGDPANVSIDSSGYLHLQINQSNNGWTAAEVFTTTSLGFGTYQWQISGPVDRMDPVTVLGLFPYGPAAGIGASGTNEIDTEFSAWDNHDGNINFDWGVYPPTSSGTHWQKNFKFSLSGGSEVTARLVWSSAGISGTLMSGLQPIGTTANVLLTTSYMPSNPTSKIPQKALPLGMNLWCYEGLPAKPQEAVIEDFTFVPEGQTPPDAGTAEEAGVQGDAADAAPPFDDDASEPSPPSNSASSTSASGGRAGGGCQVAAASQPTPFGVTLALSALVLSARRRRRG
jgi:MYXO-CTERM domain-containing protein